MIEKLHDHITDELNTNTRTDTVFIVTAILLNLVALAVNSAVASGGGHSGTQVLIVAIFIALVLIVNIVAVIGLDRGKQTRLKLLAGLVRMYADQNVAQYYDTSILESYNVRYTLFTIAVVFTGLTSIAVPLILLI